MLRLLLSEWLWFRAYVAGLLGSARQLRAWAAAADDYPNRVTRIVAAFTYDAVCECKAYDVDNRTVHNMLSLVITLLCVDGV